ncbi:MAG: hypothetical protein PHF14_10175, partial [Verrucomicrobiota bacterium]|nr:hypothetical protein [Verrucomicrobiota bacterium]
MVGLWGCGVVGCERLGRQIPGRTAWPIDSDSDSDTDPDFFWTLAVLVLAPAKLEPSRDPVPFACSCTGTC